MVIDTKKASEYLDSITEDAKPIGKHPDGSDCYTKGCRRNVPAGNKNVVFFRRYISHAADKVVKEYKVSVDKDLRDAYILAAKGSPRQKFEVVCDIVSRDLKFAIMHLIGLDISGYKVCIDADHLRHISKDHGSEGAADKSLSDPSDVARMGYVINNPDQVSSCIDEEGNPRLASVYNNKDGSKARTVLIRKQVNGQYYVTEAVVDGKRKCIFVTGAYKSRGKDPQETMAERSAPIQRL